MVVVQPVLNAPSVTSIVPFIDKPVGTTFRIGVQAGIDNQAYTSPSSGQDSIDRVEFLLADSGAETDLQLTQSKSQQIPSLHDGGRDTGQKIRDYNVEFDTTGKNTGWATITPTVYTTEGLTKVLDPYHFYIGTITRKTIWVRSTGNDANGGTNSTTDAVLTLQRAVQLCAEGDVIELEPGQQYGIATETTTFSGSQSSGSSANHVWVTIQCTGGTAYLEGTYATNDGLGQLENWCIGEGIEVRDGRLAIDPHWQHPGDGRFWLNGCKFYARGNKIGSFTGSATKTVLDNASVNFNESEMSIDTGSWERVPQPNETVTVVGGGNAGTWTVQSATANSLTVTGSFETESEVTVDVTQNIQNGLNDVRHDAAYFTGVEIENFSEFNSGKHLYRGVEQHVFSGDSILKISGISHDALYYNVLIHEAFQAGGTHSDITQTNDSTSGQVYMQNIRCVNTEAAMIQTSNTSSRVGDIIIESIVLDNRGLGDNHAEGDVTNSNWLNELSNVLVRHATIVDQDQRINPDNWINVRWQCCIIGRIKSINAPTGEQSLLDNNDVTFDHSIWDGSTTGTGFTSIPGTSLSVATRIDTGSVGSGQFKFTNRAYDTATRQAATHDTQNYTLVAGSEGKGVLTTEIYSGRPQGVTDMGAWEGAATGDFTADIPDSAPATPSTGPGTPRGGCRVGSMMGM